MNLTTAQSKRSFQCCPRKSPVLGYTLEKIYWHRKEKIYIKQIKLKKKIAVTGLESYN